MDRFRRAWSPGEPEASVMAGSVNKVILIGNLGRDPEIRALGSGDRVASFSIATSETWRDRASGERRETTEWHRISIFNDNLVKVAENYLKKGSKVYIEGSLQTRKYTDASGVEKTATEIVLQKFRGELTMLDGRGGGDDAGRDEGRAGGGRDFDGGGYASAPRAALAGPRESFSADLDDEIPF
jgi:single-strand DNA-binding protein